MVLILPVVAVAAGAVLLYAWRVERRGGGLDVPEPFKLPTRWHAAMWVGLGAVEVLSRNWRSPGYRAMRLRRVDVGTGGPVSARDALVYHAITTTSSWCGRRLMRPWQARSERRREAVRAELEEIRRAHPDDLEAQRRAMRESFSRHRVRPAASCAPPLVAAVVMQLPGFFSPRHQTIGERLTGIVVVVED